MADNAAGSGGSNLGPTNPALLDAVKARVDALKAADPGNDAPIPVDLVTASASGVDPEISVAAAEYQAPRIASARKLPVAQVRALIDRYRQGPAFGILGEPRVNVLALNLALDGKAP
jgi:K+-transporting ATPase ATPase C chain